MKKENFMRLLISLFIFTLTAVQAASYNTDPLIERGVDPRILNLTVTPFKQDLAYKTKNIYTVNEGGETKAHSLNVIYNPFNDYGIDIKIEIPKDELSDYDISHMKDELDRLMGIQSYLRDEKLYDPESLHYVGVVDGMERIDFSFAPNSIPREIKQFKTFKGSVYIKSGELYKIEVVNTEPYYSNEVDITEFKKTLYFTRPKQGSGYLLQKMDIEAKGVKNGAAYAHDIQSEVVAYWDVDKKNIALKETSTSLPQESSSTEYETIAVQLDRILPILGKATRKEGYDLPKPFGISLITMAQKTRFYMTSFEVDGEDISHLFDENSRYENTTLVSLLQFDTWVLPFLNFSLFLGGTDTVTDVTLDTNNRCLGGITLPDGSCAIADVGGESVALHGLNTGSILYGAGATLAGGAGNFFTTVNFQYMTSYTASADVKTEIVVVAPMVGYYFQDYGVRVMVGAMYEDLKETLEFDLTEAGKPNVKGVIGLRAEKWAGTAGVNYDFTRHWTSNILVSYGEDFQNLNYVVTYRW
jgi:hypothetical protein